MGQLKNLIDIRDAARMRMDRAKAELRVQFLTLESSADAKLVSSLSELIAELSTLETCAPVQAFDQVSQQIASMNLPSLEKVAENALIDALGVPSAAEKVRPGSSIQGHIPGAISANTFPSRINS